MADRWLRHPYDDADLPDCEYCGLAVMGPVEWDEDTPLHRRCFVRLMADRSREARDRITHRDPNPGRPATVDAAAMQSAHLIFRDYIEQPTDGATLDDALLEAVYAYEWAKLNAHRDNWGFTAYPSLQDARAATAVWRTEHQPRGVT